MPIALLLPAMKLTYEQPFPEWIRSFSAWGDQCKLYKNFCLTTRTILLAQQCFGDFLKTGCPMVGPCTNIEQQNARQCEQNAIYQHLSLEAFVEDTQRGCDLVPVSYVKGAVGTVVILLETVEVCKSAFQEYMVNVLQQKVKQNQEDLRELLIARRDCCDHKIEGSRGWWPDKEFLKARSITDKIAGYQRSIQAKCETLKLTSIVDIDFKVTEIQTAIVDMRTQILLLSKQVKVPATVLPLKKLPWQTDNPGQNASIFQSDLGKQQIYVLMD
ncbi:hypothetical protein B0H13DRAFT_2493727 [Mycena leptocephala]|nr:hypothetical protein B0H13DRAFT_2493727 [Mycena leptocephala]